MILRRLKRMFDLLKKRESIRPKSQLGQALDYALNQWAELEAFVNDGRIEIDNNLVENQIRPTKLGMKNWLFIGGAHTGDRSATLYTLIQSCRSQGIDPYKYLKDVLERIPDMKNTEIQSLTPRAWAKANSQKVGISAA